MAAYDVIVIGAGPGGYLAAEQAAKHGLKTLVVEKDQPGGVCLNVGCIPTKALLKCAKVFEQTLHASAYGIKLPEGAQPTVDWAGVQARKQKIVSTLTNGVKTILKMAKAEYVVGTAEIVDAHTIKVGADTHTGKYLIVATGSRSRALPLPGFKEAMAAGIMVDSTPALSFPEVPKKLVVIGGGVIGIELAMVYRSFGTDVTIVQGLDRILEVLDLDVSKTITSVLTKRGVKIIVNAKITHADGHKLFFEVNGQQQFVEGDYILQSVGRKANDEILAPLNVARGTRGEVIVNGHLQTSVPNVYLIGDAAGQVMLAHYAYHHAMHVIAHITGKNPLPTDPYLTPGCIYIQPEVATVGYTEEQLVAGQIAYVKAKMPMAACGKAVADGMTEGFVKMLACPKTGRILGVHLVSEAASDIIAEIALAMSSHRTVFDLAEAIHPHPTVSEMIAEAAKHLIFNNFKSAA